METSIVKLRAHHVANLIGYALRQRLTDTEFFYGSEFAKKAISLFDIILSGQTSVTIVDSHDDLCEVCTYRKGDGCISEGDFYSPEKGANADSEHAHNYNLAIGTTYSGKDFLRKLGLHPKN